MIIKENITIYICEHCGKKLFRKHSMVFHEQFCSSNPANKKACAGCIHLRETIVEVSVPDCSNDYDGPATRNVTGFLCEKKNIMVYPLKVQRLGLTEKYPDTFENQEPMPKDCELAEYYSGYNHEL